MLIARMAWDNLFYNSRRTAITVCLLALALAVILLFAGYMEYARRGQALAFISQTGHLQIAKAEYWDNSGDGLISRDELNEISEMLASIDVIQDVLPNLSLSGVIGKNDVSTAFWATAFDNPDDNYSYYGVAEGVPVLPDETGIGLGSVLARTLSVHPRDGETVQLMASTEEGGIALSAFNVVNITDTHIPQNDAGLVLISRSTALNFLGLDGGAHNIQIFMSRGTLTPLKEQLSAELGDEYVVKDWLELNPAYEEVEKETDRQSRALTLIFCIIIFFTLTQALSSAFNERLNEYGTLEAIGLKKKTLVVLLSSECCFLALLGIGFGLVLTGLTLLGVHIFPVTIIPPGYESGFRLEFYISPLVTLIMSCFIFLVCLAAACFPVFHVLRNSAVRLMRRA